MIGGAPALGRRAAPLPFGVVAPAVDREAVVQPEPHGVGVVAVVAGELELAPDHAGAAGGIEQPARGERVFAAIHIGGAHLVRIALLAQREARHAHAVAEVDAAAPRLVAQKILEDAAIDLVAGRG